MFRDYYAVAKALLLANAYRCPSGQTRPLLVTVASDYAYQAEWPRAHLPTAESETYKKEDSPSSADLPNLVEWRRAYLPVAERNTQRARPIHRTHPFSLN